MYAGGKGVARDEAEAVRWFRKAAAQNNRAAQSNLGWVYATGRGVQRDDAEAFKWFLLAASQGGDRAKGGISASQADPLPSRCTELERLAQAGAAKGTVNEDKRRPEPPR